MRKVALVSTLALLLPLAISAAQNSAKSRTFSGEIMDDQCAAMGSHDMMMQGEGAKNARECTLGCVHNGAKFVLFNADAKTVYELDDQKKPEQFAGQKVNVKGTLDEASKTIHVENISK